MEITYNSEYLFNRAKAMMNRKGYIMKQYIVNVDGTRTVTWSLLNSN